MRKEYAARLRALCECAVFLSCAMVLSYIESLFPLPLPLPGIKPGLANAAVLTLLLCRPAGYALAVSLARVVLSGLLFGNLSGFAMSFAGAVFSFAVSYILKRAGVFGAPGISVGGAAAHNTAQVAVCAVITGSAAVFYYLPALLLAAIPTGLVTGFTAWGIQKRVRAGGRAAKEDTEKTGVH